MIREATLCLLVRGDPVCEVCLGYKKAGFGAGRWTGFGGKVEPGESPSRAATRELIEETGVAAREEDLHKVGELTFLFRSRPAWSQRVHVYRVTSWQGEPYESHEIRPAWFAVDGLPLDGMWQDGQHWLPPILAGHRVRATYTFADDNETIQEIVEEPWNDAAGGSMIGLVNNVVDQIEDRVIAYRRDFHRHAEVGWTEFRTASLVARRLHELGYQIRIGREVLDDGERMGLPPADVLEVCWQRAGRQGGDPEYLAAVRGGFPAVVATLAHGEGPTVGLRFEMDALELGESQSPDHRPQHQGFASVNPEAMHACAHDAHTAIGLGVAEVLATLQDRIHGRVVLLFQPAEEGVRGARAMVAAGVVDHVSALLGLHLYSGWDLGQLDPGRSGFLATSKFDAILTGAPAHAGGKPHLGRNALLAAATAVLNMHAIPRHGDGVTRINVGRLSAGTGRNVIPAEAHLVIETRGATTELNRYMAESALRVLDAAAAMYGCELEVRPMGAAGSARSDALLAERVWAVAQEMGGFDRRPPEQSRGSEDYTDMMERVQSRGGLATNIGLGAGDEAGGHHTAEFDIDERALKLAVQLLSAAALDLMMAPALQRSDPNVGA